MRSNKQAIFAFTYGQEGGYGNDPNDPGGATNLGIIQTEYTAYRIAVNQPPQSVRHIARAEADDIYTKYYWDKVHGDELPSGIDLVVYDYAVNSGVSRAIRYAQWVLGVKADGILGPITLQAFKSADPRSFVLAYDAKRLAFLQGLGIFQYFGEGWTRRVKMATNAALKVIDEAPKYVAAIKEEKTPMLLDIILGIARHAITGSGAGIAASSGFDLHSPTTWFGIATFIGGSVFSAVDKAQKSGHFDLLSLVTGTLADVNAKLDAASDAKAS